MIKGSPKSSSIKAGTAIDTSQTGKSGNSGIHVLFRNREARRRETKAPAELKGTAPGVGMAGVERCAGNKWVFANHASWGLFDYCNCLYIILIKIKIYFDQSLARTCILCLALRV